MEKPQLIVMLTHNDYTVKDANAVFAACADSEAMYWGAKEQGISHEELLRLFAAVKISGKKSVLEVVAYTEEEGLAGAKLAAECGCDVLLGTVFFDSIEKVCRENGILYLPYVGQVSQRPSILEGKLEDMVQQAAECVEKGAAGVNLLGYRYQGDGFALSCSLVSQVDAPVCLAGGINSFSRLEELKKIAPTYFTIGSAFFEHRFGDEIAQQIHAVCHYVAE